MNELNIVPGTTSAGALRQARLPVDAKGSRLPAASFGSSLPAAFATDPHLVMIGAPHSPLAERYRRIRLRLEQGAGDDASRRQVTVITSAIPGEGKTTTATNLALAYAESRKHSTLLIGADLRGPSISRFLNSKPACGLSDVLAGDVPLDQALIELSRSKLWVLPEGSPSQRPLEIVQSESLGHLIATLRGRFDRIVIDTSPTVPYTDAAILASHADGVLLVVRAGTTTPLIRRAWDSLSGTNALGVVLNDVVFTIVDRYYSGYDDYEASAYADYRLANRAKEPSITGTGS